MILDPVDRSFGIPPANNPPIPIEADGGAIPTLLPVLPACFPCKGAPPSAGPVDLVASQNNYADH